MSGRGEKNLLPLIRHLSACTTPLLARLPVTPNQITSGSMLIGLAAACYLYWCKPQNLPSKPRGLNDSTK